jgi:hypothetical protein
LLVEEEKSLTSSARRSGLSSIEKVRAPSIISSRLLGSVAASLNASSRGKNSSSADQANQ